MRKSKMRNKKVYQMVLLAMFIALMTIMTFIPQIGFIQITPIIAFTLLHIPVLVGAYLYGWKYGLILGFAFGLLSWLRAMLSPVTFLDPFFVNPLISVFPRVAFGLLAGLFFELVRKAKKLYLRGIFAGISSAGLTLFHSALVLTMLGLFEGPGIGVTLGANYWVLMGTIIGSNGVSEAVVAFLLVPTISIALLKASGQKNIEKPSQKA
jgi:uncharacterized membrane protein